MSQNPEDPGEPVEPIDDYSDPGVVRFPDRKNIVGRPTKAYQDANPGWDKSERGQMFGRLRVLGVDDIDTAPPRKYLLKGVMSLNEISIWVGAPKCGKSFLLLSIAYKLALGLRVFGHRVRACKVLYIAAEGEGGIANRIKALRTEYGTAPNFHYIAQPIDLMRDDGHKQEVIDAATELGSELIVVDTLNRALAGGSENKPEDMGMLIVNVSHIREHTNAHVAVVHHGTKASDGRSPRGHGSLEGADDALIEVVKQQDGSRLATLVHSKDDSDGPAWGFKLKVVELGQDEDGDPITTLIVQELVETPDRVEKPKRLSDNEVLALECLDWAMATYPRQASVGGDTVQRPVTSETMWRQRFYEVKPRGDHPDPEKQQEAKRQAFKRACDGLIAKKRVAFENELVWRPDVWGF